MKKSEMKEQIAALQAQIANLRTEVDISGPIIDRLNEQVARYQYPTPSLAMQKVISAFQRDRWSGFTAVSERILKATHAANARNEKFTSNDARRMTLASPEFQEWMVKNYVGGDK